LKTTSEKWYSSTVMSDFIFFLVLIFLLALSVFVYRYHGRKEVIRFDLVQFVYSFVLAPVGFVWFKTFLYSLMQSELNQGFSSRSLFIIDTAFSVYFLYLFAFVVIHSLTKSFQLKAADDPLYDLFHDNEYFHLWLTHIVIFGGSMLMTTFFATINLFFPFDFQANRPMMVSVTSFGAFSGVLFFVALWMADPKQEGANFLRLMKLIAAAIFVFLVGIYFAIDPTFSGEYVFFWWSLFAFAGVVGCSAFAYKSVRAQSLFTRLVNKITRNQVFTNIQLFK
jgi:hypothetical protein